MSFHEKGQLILSDQGLDALMPLHLRVDASGVIRHVAPTLRKLCEGCDVIGKPLFEMMDIRTSRDLSNFTELSELSAARLKLNFKQGSKYALKGLYVPLPDQGAILNMSLGISMRDVVRDHGLSAADFAPTDSTVDMLYLIEANTTAWGETKRLTERLRGAKNAAEEQAFSDALTGLKNRRAMDHFIGRLLEKPIPFGLMSLDLDYFKQVNDTLGHAAGDHVLQKVSKILISETREGDIIARVGGDEFVLAFRNCVDPKVIDTIATRIIERLEVPMLFEGNICNVSASAGTTLSTHYVAPDLDVMLAHADAALYESKRKGRACHTMFSPENPLKSY